MSKIIKKEKRKIISICLGSQLGASWSIIDFATNLILYWEEVIELVVGELSWDNTPTVPKHTSAFSIMKKVHIWPIFVVWGWFGWPNIINIPLPLIVCYNTNDQEPGQNRKRVQRKTLKLRTRINRVCGADTRANFWGHIFISASSSACPHCLRAPIDYLAKSLQWLPSGTHSMLALNRSAVRCVQCSSM